MASILYEIPTGLINGVNKVFTVVNTPSFVTLNGPVQTPGGVDYTLTGFTLTFVNAPNIGASLLSFYLYQSANPILSTPSTSAYFITLAQLKNDIAAKMKGTSLKEIGDFYGTVAGAGNRMLARIDTEETRRTITLATPFYDNVQDYALPSDYKRMIDIRPQANRLQMPGRSHFNQTAVRQFNERLNANSFSIHWNNMVQTIRAQQLPIGNVLQMDSFDTQISNGSWSAEGDASGLYPEVLNYVEGNGSLGFNLSGVTGLADIVNTTATVTDLSALKYNDASVYALYIPIGFSNRFVSLTLRRGSDASNYKHAVTTSKIDGTAFTDGWNLVMFNWNSATTNGTPDDTKNTYRRLGFQYTVGPVITGVLVDNWTDALGNLYEMEYYSNYLFRTASGSWINIPTLDTDLVNVSLNSYEILKSEIMIDVIKEIRTGAVQSSELADYRLMLNGQPQSRYVKDPPYHGAYADYLKSYPSSAIVTVTRTYDFDV
jgi:hypothetical protein